MRPISHPTSPRRARRPSHAGRAAALASLALAALCWATAGAVAQEGGTPADTAREPQAATPTLPSLDRVRVVGVRRLGTEPPGRGPVRARIGDIILLDVRSLEDLLARSTCRTTAGVEVPGCRETGISLYLDGREIEGLVPESGAPDVESGTLQYHLARTHESDEIWADLLGAPSLGSVRYRPTEASVGLAGEYALPTDVDAATFELVRVRTGWGILYLVILIGFVAAMIILGRSSGMLRDSGPSPPSGRKPYSLGRTQMAWWFFWVVAAFLGIWLITGATDTITATALALIGIGAGTALGAAAIDSGKTQGLVTSEKRLRQERAAITHQIQEIDAALAATPAPANAHQLSQDRGAKQGRLEQVDAELAELKPRTDASESKGFLLDLLTDHTGISFHRLQMAVWTVVLTVLFVDAVWTRLSMPEFDATLLALLGISSGTYLGFKIPEQKTE